MSGFIAPRDWSFVADMNYSGSVTVTDVGLWVQWLFFYPGDIVINMMTTFFPQASGLLGINNEVYGGLISFILSCFLWWVMLKVMRKNLLPLWSKESYFKN
ncbi:hypothetical protein [Photobacterium lipolyticum]|uniref:Uncharacterized protein n=1 Tax=Photobacterium lipolyticum TaxID=266810 RepID=A0A2T3N2I1_9GAMM|nr:hypothetical protein [Photobacterium lipolyticum]PSW06582.1 hypothetical protein C9I89_03330 [Photobacterium lipolyticum]